MGLQPRVEQAVTFIMNKLFPYGDHIIAALFPGGIDFKCPAVKVLLP
jgi:hypothetical protein